MSITRVPVANDSGDRTSGSGLDQAFFTSLYDSIEGAWLTNSYTPAITASTTNPTTSGATGKFLNIGGKLVFFRATLTLATVGSGNYFVSLPVTAEGSTIGADITVKAQDVSAGSAVYNGSAFLDTTTRVALHTVDTAAAAAFTPTVPFTFASGDIITVQGWYFAA